MSQFTDSLKRATESSAQATQTQNEIRLHKARIIRAKASMFWDATKDVIRAECIDMQTAFPNNPRYNPFVNEQSGFSVHCKTMPRKILMFDLDIEGQYLLTSEGIKHSVREQPIFTPTGPISITVGTEEELVFGFRGQSHDTPESLACAIISHVCGIVRPVTPPSS